MTDPLRAGIIGGGWIARVHVPAIDAEPGLELVAACDTDSERAEAISGPRGGTAYTRFEEMLEHEQLDVLWVCTPPLFHRGPVEAALARGVHVYLEKPIARTLEDADAIVAAASSSRAICAVGYQYHASELLDDALALLEGQQPGTARQPELRSRRGPAVVHGSRAGRRADPRAREPPHRPAAGARRTHPVGAGDGGHGGPLADRPAERHRGRDLPHPPLRERRARIGALGVDARGPARAVRGRRRGQRRDARAAARTRALPAQRALGRPRGREASTANRWIVRSRASSRPCACATSASSPANPHRRATRSRSRSPASARSSRARTSRLPDDGPPAEADRPHRHRRGRLRARTSRSSRRSGSSCDARDRIRAPTCATTCPAMRPSS